MPRVKKPLPEFHDVSKSTCPKCGAKKSAIKYCGSCPQVDRIFISGEHIHIRCGVCFYEAQVMNTLDRMQPEEPEAPRVDPEKDGV